MQIKNNGDVTAYVPLDNGQSHPLEPGSSVDVRPGTAEYAVRNITGVEWGTEPQPNGLAEASTEAGIGPIGAYVEANPTDVRYAVVNDSPFAVGDVTVVGSDVLAGEGGITEAPTGTAPAVTPAEDPAPARSSRRTAAASTEGSENA